MAGKTKVKLKGQKSKAEANGVYGPVRASSFASSLFKVLTAEEVAQLLRIDSKTVIDEAEAGRIPGRKIGAEWRFLQFALAEWLHNGAGSQTQRLHSSKKRLAAQIGAWKDDPTVDAMVEEIYRQRKRHLVGGD